MLNIAEPEGERVKLTVSILEGTLGREAEVALATVPGSAIGVLH